jgi:peptidoglycan/LPS O-acetylase OafA/YrhL
MMGRWTEELKLGNRESLYHDLLRVVLIIQVIFGHIAALTLPQMPALLSEPVGNAVEITLKLLTRYGPQAAYLFIFLSGYMVAGPLIGDVAKGNPLSFRSFVQRRLRKLMPGVFLGLAITACLDGLAIFVLGKSTFYQDIIGLDVLANFRLDVLIGNIFFLEPTFVPAFGSNGPLWTLGYIFQYYLAGFALLQLARLNPIAAALLAVVLVGLSALTRPEWSILFIVWLLGGWARNIRISGVPPSALLLSAIILFLVSNLFAPLYSAATSGLVGSALVFALRSVKLFPVDRLEAVIRPSAIHTYLAYAVHFPIVVFAAAMMDRWQQPLATFAITSAATALGILVLIIVNNRVGSLFSRISEQR